MAFAVVLELGLVVASQSDAGQSIADKHGLDALVEGGRAAKGGKNVHLEDLGLLIRIDDDIEPVDFKAISSAGWILLKLSRDVGLH